MAFCKLFLQLALLSAALLCYSDSVRGSALHKLLKDPDAGGEARSDVLAVEPSEATQFLAAPGRRQRRNLWDRSRPDVQQWIMQFMHMGYDEAEDDSSLNTRRGSSLSRRLEADLSYWMDQSRSSDQGRQHHYDENAAIGPQQRGSYRHGANVNYDYY